MPQMNKGGKFIFGISVINEDFTVQLPMQAINEYDITKEGRIYLCTGSKKTGGFIVMRKELLYNSKLDNILKDNNDLCTYTINEGVFIPYKGRKYCWCNISNDGRIQLSGEMMSIFHLEVGTKLLSIRSSNIAFTMGAKGPLLEKANNYIGEIEQF